jgi:secreted Zn-dependent insulinase-like peptidase
MHENFTQRSAHVFPELTLHLDGSRNKQVRLGMTQGAAHFLEHMLFLGSESFPGESDLNTFLTRFGGESNAHTETQHTCVHAEVSSHGLEGALERFAAAFHAPLLHIGAMQREVRSQW